MISDEWLLDCQRLCMENQLSGEGERKRIDIVNCSLIRLGVGSEDKFYIIIILIQRVTIS